MPHFGDTGILALICIFLVDLLAHAVGAIEVPNRVGAPRLEREAWSVIHRWQQRNSFPQDLHLPVGPKPTCLLGLCPGRWLMQTSKHAILGWSPRERATS